jgi:hypothetical protein
VNIQALVIVSGQNWRFETFKDRSLLDKCALMYYSLAVRRHAGPVTHEKNKTAYRILVGTPEGKKRHLGNLNVGGRMMIK